MVVNWTISLITFHAYINICYETELSSAHNILSTTKLKFKKKNTLTKIDQNGYCWKLAPISA